MPACAEARGKVEDSVNFTDFDFFISPTFLLIVDDDVPLGEPQKRSRLPPPQPLALHQASRPGGERPRLARAGGGRDGHVAPCRTQTLP